jgi:LacI family transcriptional regulator
MERATIRDVARLAGVSSSTVSRYLNDSAHLSTSARERIAGAMAKLGYRPDATARTMRTRRSRCLGVLVPDIANPFFVEIASAIERTAAEHGYTVMICNTDEDSAKEERLVQTLIDRSVDGLIMIACDGTTPAIIAQAGRLPMVAIDRVVDHSLVMSIAGDNFTGAALATRRLLGLGHRRIAFLTGPLSIPAYNERYAGFREALDGAALAWDQSLFLGGHATVEEGQRVVAAAHQSGRRFTAIFAASDLLAIGALLAARQRGLALPDDLSVIGYDNIPFSAYVHPGLSTVDQPKREMGRMGAIALIQALDSREPLEAKVLRIAPRLVMRGSCAPVKGGEAGSVSRAD